MEEIKEEKDIKIIADKIELTREEYDRIVEDLEIAQTQLSIANDTLNGGITSRNMANFRNTYVINAQDSLDSSYPMYVYFNVLDETVKIVSVKVSYWIHKYRAYSKASLSGGGQTTSNGGGQTTSSGGSSTPTTSSGGATTPTSAAAYGDSHTVMGVTSYQSVTNVGDQAASGILIVNGEIQSVTGTSHTHTISIPNHTHTVTIANHTHTVANHTHTVANHTHNAVYGIFEEDNTPTIKFNISQDGGVGYGKEFGNTVINQSLLDITDQITSSGNKVIKFESTTRARLSVQVEVKLDIKVR